MNGKTVGDVLMAMDQANGVKLLRELATACFTNANLHHEAANLLAENGYDGAAAALAVIGVEELAKAILYTAAAVCPSEWAVLGPERRFHELKHLIAATAEGAEIECSDGWAVEADYSEHWPSKKERLQDMFTTLLRHGLEWLLGDPKDARNFYNQLQTQSGGIIVTPKLKEAGLYVDLASTGQVLTPARVASDVQSAILGLQWYLETFAGLPEVLEDDEMWQGFEQSVGEARRPQSTPAQGGSEGTA